MEYAGKGGAAAVRGWLRLFVLISASLLSFASHAQPFPSTLCAAGRISQNLNCTANDIKIASIAVNNASSCVAGTTVALDLTLQLQVTAQARYNIGVFIANDGLSPIVKTASGGANSCFVTSSGFAPPPLADLDGNACGDSSAANALVAVPIGLVNVLCKADANGNLLLPAVVTWDTQSGTPTSCNAPTSDWVFAGTPAKCNADILTSIPVTVVGGLTIVKNTTGGDGTFSYTGTGFTGAGTGEPPFNITTSGGTGQHAITGLATGVQYTITEGAPGVGFTLSGLSCTGGTTSVNGATATITLTNASPNVTCTYVNSAPGSITIVKNTVGGNGAFPFTATGTGVSNFSITTVGNTGSHPFTGLSAGTYVFQETPIPAGWSLTGLSCSGNSTTTLATGIASVTLAAGDAVTCTYTDTRQPTVAVTKVSNGGVGQFSFTGSNGFANQNITTVTPGVGVTGATQTLTAAGVSTTITESAPPAGFVLASISCSGLGSGGTATPNVGARTVTLDAAATAAGAAIACTFVNTAQSGITINKTAVGGNGTFNFTSTVPGSAAFPITTASGSGGVSFSSIPPGTYTVTESGMPTGWSLTNLSCVDPTGDSTVNLGTATATIVLAAGESVSCTFTDTLALPPPPPTTPANIPTLTEWALIMLGMLLLATGWIQYRRRQ
jgi:hypothetical protein